MQFVEAVSGFLIAQGFGSAYSESGISMQDGMRRDTGAETVVLLRQTGGAEIPGSSPGKSDTSEDYGLQVLVDSETVSGARGVSRDIYNALNEVQNASVISGFQILWLRAVAPPQDVGPGPGTRERFVVSTNYTARLLR